MHRLHWPTMLLAFALLPLPGCRGPSELPPPGPEEARRIRAAVDAYLARESSEATPLSLLGVGSGVTRSVTVETIGDPRIVRSRYFQVPARARVDGSTADVVFFVLANGPVYVVDTAVIAPAREARFSP